MQHKRPALCLFLIVDSILSRHPIYPSGKVKMQKYCDKVVEQNT